MCAEAACPLERTMLRCFGSSSKSCGVDAARMTGYRTELAVPWYRTDWEPEAPSGRRALGVFWRYPVVLWGPSTPNPTQVS